MRRWWGNVIQWRGRSRYRRQAPQPGTSRHFHSDRYWLVSLQTLFCGLHSPESGISLHAIKELLLLFCFNLYYFLQIFSRTFSPEEVLQELGNFWVFMVLNWTANSLMSSFFVFFLDHMTKEPISCLDGISEGGWCAEADGLGSVIPASCRLPLHHQWNLFHWCYVQHATHIDGWCKAEQCWASRQVRAPHSPCFETLI